MSCWLELREQNARDGGSLTIRIWVLNLNNLVTETHEVEEASRVNPEFKETELAEFAS